jgi:nucleotide-binding universal stress UspA family protein
MDYKTVMVGLALDRPNDASLRVAGDLAERFGARIIGVAASDIRPPMYFADGDFAQKLLDEEAAAIERRLSELEAEFRAAVERGATALEWRSARSFPVPYLLQQARAADILVIGARPETLVDPSSAPDPSDLVMQAGRSSWCHQRWNGSTSEAFWWPGRMFGKRGGPYSTHCRFWLPPRKSRLPKFPSRTGAARKRLPMLPTWRRGCAATASQRTRLFPKRPAA